jgi:hypothetical protein
LACSRVNFTFTVTWVLSYGWDVSLPLDLYSRYPRLLDAVCNCQSVHATLRKLCVLVNVFSVLACPVSYGHT